VVCGVNDAACDVDIGQMTSHDLIMRSTLDYSSLFEMICWPNVCPMCSCWLPHQTLTRW